MEGENRKNATGIFHKYTRSLLLDHFGAESLKGKLVPQIEVSVSKTLETWSTHSSIEVKQAASIVRLFYWSETSRLHCKLQFSH